MGTPRECDTVLGNGVALYFSSAAHLVDNFRTLGDLTTLRGPDSMVTSRGRNVCCASDHHLETYHAVRTRWPHGRHCRTSMTNSCNGLLVAGEGCAKGRTPILNACLVSARLDFGKNASEQRLLRSLGASSSSHLPFVRTPSVENGLRGAGCAACNSSW